MAKTGPPSMSRVYSAGALPKVGKPAFGSRRLEHCVLAGRACPSKTVDTIRALSRVFNSLVTCNVSDGVFR